MTVPLTPTGKRRMRNGWKSAQSTRYKRDRKPRQSFELTLDEWDRLGGTTRPVVEGFTRTAGQFGVHGAPVPAVHPDCAQLWLEVAERLNLVHLTISWPDAYELTFTAEPA